LLLLSSTSTSHFQHVHVVRALWYLHVSSTYLLLDFWRNGCYTRSVVGLLVYFRLFGFQVIRFSRASITLNSLLLLRKLALISVITFHMHRVLTVLVVLVYDVAVVVQLHDCLSILTQSASLFGWRDSRHSGVSLGLNSTHYVGRCFDELLSVVLVGRGVSGDELALCILIDEFTWLLGVAHGSSNHCARDWSLSFRITSVLTTRISPVGAHGGLVSSTLLQEVRGPDHSFVAVGALSVLGSVFSGGI
jgi:hypothetical protein